MQATTSTMIRQMIKGQTNSRRDGEGEEKQKQKLVDRPIHSIEEGFQETTATDYSVQAIPPFRGNRNGRGAGAVDNIMDDSSSHSASSLGAQSNFIQRRINMHREKGEWSKETVAAVSSDDDDHDDYYNEEAKDSVRSVSTRNNTDAAGQNTNECSDINNKPNTELTRQSSIVSFLKMEPICEKKQLRNTINYEDESNNKSSFKSDVSGISDHDEGYNIGDMDMTTPDENETNNGEDVLPRRSSFLPNVNLPNDDTKRYVEVEIKSMVDVNKGDYAYNGTHHSGGDDSDTFGFASIHSTDNITHASDAPDYDYNSEHGKEDKSDTEDRIPSIRAGQHTEINAEARHMQKFIPPMERRRVSQQRQAHATGKDTVCEVLGLPKDKPRKVHRGIMSADTEIRLRDLMGGKDSSSVNHINSSASKLEPNEGNAPSSVGSDDSSIDLAFGDTSERPAKEEDRWERLRLERQIRRASIPSATTSANTNWTSSVRKLKAENEKEESSWHNSFNWIKSPLRTVYNNDEDDNTTVGQTSTGATMIGKLYSRFQRPSESDDDESSESSSDSDDSSSSDDSSDDGETWHENILTEGQYYLSMSMLVYVYGLLRETSLLGHTEITFDEVDVNSSQSESRMDKSHRYLNNTKSAGFIIRVVMDELEKKGAFSSIEKEGDMR